MSNKINHFNILLRGSSSYSSKLLASPTTNKSNKTENEKTKYKPGPFVFGTNGGSTFR
jgi:hypothetical protein